MNSGHSARVFVAYIHTLHKKDAHGTHHKAQVSELTAHVARVRLHTSGTCRLQMWHMSVPSRSVLPAAAINMFGIGLGTLSVGRTGIASNGWNAEYNTHIGTA